MDINSISGADVMPRGVLENSRDYGENVNTLEKKEGEKSVMVKEENKGTTIDIVA